jgi:hypothetical protein
VKINGLLAVLAVIFLLSLAIVSSLAILNHSARLIAEDVELGDVPPSQLREFQITVENGSSMSVHISPPKGDCGCITSQVGSVDLSAHQKYAFPFTITTDSAFGPFHRSILFTGQSEDHKSRELHVSVAGNVISDWVCTPSSLGFAADTIGEARLSIRTLKPRAMSELTLSGPSNLVDIVALPVDEQTPASTRTYLIKSRGIAGEGFLEGHIDRSPKGANDVFKVPVFVQSNQPIRAVPERIQLNGYGKFGSKFTRSVTILSSKVNLTTCDIKCLVNWVAAEADSSSETAMSLKVTFDAASMPESISNIPVLEISKPPEILVIKAFGYKH